MKNLFTLVCILLSLCAVSGSAAVLDSSETGFTIESSATVNTTPERAYQQFMQINEWWNGDHSWFGSADNFFIEPKVGGCFCEISGKQQAWHMTVSFIDPGKEVRLLGGLGPLQMMGITGAMSWKFEQLDNKQGKNMTRITQRYAVSGPQQAKLISLAPIVDQVQADQLKRLAGKF